MDNWCPYLHVLIPKAMLVIYEPTYASPLQVSDIIYYCGLSQCLSHAVTGKGIICFCDRVYISMSIYIICYSFKKHHPEVRELTDHDQHKRKTDLLRVLVALMSIRWL